MDTDLDLRIGAAGVTFFVTHWFAPSPLDMVTFVALLALLAVAVQFLLLGE